MQNLHDSQEIRSLNEDFLFDPKHLNKFHSIVVEEQKYVPRAPKALASKVGASSTMVARLPDKVLYRADLFALCADSSVSPEECFLAIMAWGGMRFNHGEMAWASRSHWRVIVEKLRAGVVSRHTGYAEFQDLRREKLLGGMGPAFYTKLIFFCHPRHDGYIMDQWTGLGMNLLVAEPSSGIAHLSTGHVNGRRYDRITDGNSADVYEKFCLAIEELARQCDLSPQATEERLFSWGGRNAGEWRRYLMSHRT